MFCFDPKIDVYKWQNMEFRPKPFNQKPSIFIIMTANQVQEIYVITTWTAHHYIQRKEKTTSCRTVLSEKSIKVLQSSCLCIRRLNNIRSWGLHQISVLWHMQHTAQTHQVFPEMRREVSLSGLLYRICELCHRMLPELRMHIFSDTSPLKCSSWDI